MFPGDQMGYLCVALSSLPDLPYQSRQAGQFETRGRRGGGEGGTITA